jgi:hypothetical protein
VREPWWRDEGAVERLAVGGFLLAFAAAAVLLIWEGRGLTLTVDEWSWGFASRTNFDLHAFVDPHNGHFAAVLVLLTKGSLQLFGADAALPLRLLAVALHLATATCLFLLMRQVIGTAAAAVPAVLVMFLGAANDGIVGSHGMSVTITVLAGLGAWLAIQRRQLGWDVFAAALLVLGVAAESTAIPFVLGAAVMLALDRDSPRSRYWIVVLPVAVYALWWLAYGRGEESDIAIANLAALPAFVFDSLAATLGSIAGVFTTPGNRTQGFDITAGQALAGGFLMVLLALVVGKRYRPGLASAVPMSALLLFWLMISSVASADRAPFASRYIYINVILLLLVFAQEIGVSPWRRQASLALAAICALALLPNIRELTYAADGARVQAEINRAAMGAANLVYGEAPAATLLEDPADLQPGEVVDLGFPLEQYGASEQRFGAPAFSPAQIAAAAPEARAAADHFLARALAIGVVPASGAPRALPARIDADQTGGVLQRRDGCLRFVPLASGARLSLRLPPGGLWIRPGTGAPVPAGVDRFDDSFDVVVAPVLPGRPSQLELPAGPASAGWRAQLEPTQPLLVCAA